jgi:hypothetical protein
MHSAKIQQLLQQRGELLGRDLSSCFVYGSASGTMPEAWTRIVGAIFVPVDQQVTGYASYIVVPRPLPQEAITSHQLTLVSPETQTTVDQVNWSMEILELTHIALRAAGQESEPERQAFFTQRFDRVMIYHHLELLLDSLPEESRQPFLEGLRRLITDAGELAQQQGVYPALLREPVPEAFLS